MARCRTGLDFADRSARGTRRAWTLPTSYGCAAGGEVGALDFTGRTPPPVPAWTLPTRMSPPTRAWALPTRMLPPGVGLDFTDSVAAVGAAWALPAVQR